MDALGRKDMSADRLDERHQRGRRRAHPVGERRDIEIDAFSRIDVALPVERQMQAVLGEQDMGEELRPGPPARDRVRWGRRLADRFAGPARELLAHMLDYLPLARMSSSVSVTSSPILRSVVPPQHGQTDGCRIDDPLARQLIGQRTARRLAPFERRHRYLLACRRGNHLRRCLRLRSVLLQIGQLQLKLIEQQRTALRGLAEPLVAELPDRELELLDQQRPVLRFALRRRGSLLSCTQGRPLRDDERMRNSKIGRKRIINASSRI